jgi:hypothetical protein
MNRSPSFAPVPERYVGLWRRRLLESESVRDTDTEVWWLQTGSLYADLRQPARMQPAARTTPLQLARQEGFAGALEVKGDLLTWHRWLDFRPPTGIADVGRMHFEGALLIEYGVHARYREVWERTAAASDDRLALALQSERADGGEWRARRGVLVVLGDYFMFALDPGLRLAHGSALKSGRAGAFAVFRLDCEISFGVRRGRVPWEIQHSSLPAREGMSLPAVHGLPEPDDSGVWQQRVPVPASVRRWQVVEIGAGFRGFA